MVLVLCAAVLCAFSVYGLRSAFAAGAPADFRGFDGVGVLAGFGIAAGASLLFGPWNGLSAIVALLIYETGHWVALRLLGHPRPIFRLFPLLTGDTPPPLDADEAVVFRALMAPGLAVPFMVLALSFAITLNASAPTAAEFCRALTLSLCLLGTINLLPFRGLAGGQIAAAAARVLSPSVLPLSVACAVAGLALAGWSTGMVWAYAVAVLGLVGLAFPASPQETQPMAIRTAGLAVAAWAAIAIADVAGSSLVLLGRI